MGKDNKFMINGYCFDEIAFKDDDYVVYNIKPSEILKKYVFAKAADKVVPGISKSMSWMDNVVINMDDFINIIQDPTSAMYDRLSTIISNTTKYGIKKIEPIIQIDGDNYGIYLKASFAGDTPNDEWSLSNYKKFRSNTYGFDMIWRIKNQAAISITFIVGLLSNYESSDLDQTLKNAGYNEETDIIIHVDINIDSYTIHPNGNLHRDDRYGNMWEITYSISRIRGIQMSHEDIVVMLSLIHGIRDPHSILNRTSEFRTIFNPNNPIHKEILYCKVINDSKGALGIVKTRLYTDHYGKLQFSGDSSMGIIDLDSTPWSKSNSYMWDYMGLLNSCGIGCPRASYVIPYNLEAHKSSYYPNEMQLSIPMLRFYKSIDKVNHGNGFRVYKIKYSKLDYLLHGLIFFHVETTYSDDPYKIEKFLDIDLHNNELIKKMGLNNYIQYTFNHFLKYYNKNKDKYFFIPLDDSNTLEEFRKSEDNFADFFFNHQKIAFALVRKGQKYNGHELSEGLAWFLG